MLKCGESESTLGVIGSYAVVCFFFFQYDLFVGIHALNAFFNAF